MDEILLVSLYSKVIFSSTTISSLKSVTSFFSCLFELSDFNSKLYRFYTYSLLS